MVQRFLQRDRVVAIEKAVLPVFVKVDDVFYEYKSRYRVNALTTKPEELAAANMEASRTDVSGILHLERMGD